MAKYIDIKLGADGTVSIVDNGAEMPFNLGQQVSMGLGSIELRNTKKAGLHIVRTSSSGHFKYSVRLNREGRFRLGPDRGFRVVSPEEENDPIKRVFREMDIPMSKLRQMSEGEVLKISTYSCDIDRAYPDGTEINRFVTDGTENTKEVSSRDMTSVNQYCGPEISEAGTITGATYAVEIVRHAHNQYIGKYVGEVVVWPSCDPAVLADVLAPVIYGESADREYPMALKNFEAAQRWVAKKFEIVPHPEKGDTILANGEKYSVLADRMHGVLGRLVGVHGIALIEDRLGARQRSFLEAVASEKSAAQYILENYRVVATKKGDEQYLKFALQSAPEKLGAVNSTYLNGEEEMPLKILLEKHKSLKDALWEKAPEKKELVTSYPIFSSLRNKNGIWGIGDHQNSSPLIKELVNEEDAANIYLRDNEVKQNLVCLSSFKRFKGNKSVNIGEGNFFLDGGIVAVLCDGDEAFASICSSGVILPLEVGETKNLVLNVRPDHRSFDEPEAMVWGITVSRTEAGVTYAPYDNGKLYTCEGHLGSEVSAEVLAE